MPDRENSSETPRISIITVCRNSGATIRSTLSSVAAQSYRNFEHIIVDGASTDDTLTLLKQWREYPLQVVSGPDKGIYDAMNKGIAMATGDVVGFLNSDDLYADSGVLGQIAAVFRDPGMEACYADLVYVKKDDVDSVVRYWKSSPYRHGAFASGWCPAHPTFYARKCVFERLGPFNLAYRLAADADLMIRFLEKGGIAAVYVSQIWVRMRVGGQTNLSLGNIVRQNREILASLGSHGVPVSPTRFIAAKIYSRILQRWSKTHAE